MPCGRRSNRHLQVTSAQRNVAVFPLTLFSFVREVSLQFLLLAILFLFIPLGIWILPPFVILSGLAIAVSIWAMQCLVGVFNLKRVTIPAFFYFMYLGIILIPGFFIFNDEITQSRWRFLIGIESVLLTVPCGVWVANVFSNFRKEEIASYFEGPIASEPSGKSAQRVYLTVLTMASALVVLNLWETPVIPLLYLIRHPGESLQVALLREDSFKLLTSKFTYAYYVVRTTIFPFLILVGFGRYLYLKQMTWKWLFVISLVLGVFYASLTIEKSPVAAIAGIIGIFYYLYKGGNLGRTASILFPVLFLLFPIIVIVLAFSGSEGGTLGAALQAMATRIFYSPAEVVYAYFEIFPDVFPFQHGASVLKFAHLMGWQTVDIPNLVGLYMTGGQGIDTVFANACFIGNANADFGLPGVLVHGILAGFLMQIINIFFCRKPKSVVNLSAYAICFWAFGILVASALSTQMLSGGVTFALLLRWAFRYRHQVPGGFGQGKYGHPSLESR